MAVVPHDVVISAGLWIAVGTYMHVRLTHAHRKLDRIFEHFNGLREYLYEIDPQFDDERLSSADVRKGNSVFANIDHAELIADKRSAGFRTLDSHFLDSGFLSPRVGQVWD